MPGRKHAQRYDADCHRHRRHLHQRNRAAPHDEVADVPDGHEFYNYLPEPGPARSMLDPNQGAVPFLLGGPPVMIKSPRDGETIPAGLR